MSQTGPHAIRHVPHGATIPDYPVEGLPDGSAADAGNQTARESLTTGAPVGGLAEAPLPTTFNDSDFRTLTASSDAISFVVDKNGYFLHSDGKSLLALGFSPDQVVGQSAFKIYERAPSIINGIQHALEGNSSHCNVTVGGADFDVSFTPRLR